MKVLKLGSLLLLLLAMPLWAHASAPLLLEQPVTLQNPADLKVLYADADATVQAVSNGTE